MKIIQQSLKDCVFSYLKSNPNTSIEEIIKIFPDEKRKTIIMYRKEWIKKNDIQEVIQSSLSKEILHFMENHPDATNSEVYNAFPPENKQSIRVYLNNFRRNREKEFINSESKVIIGKKKLAWSEYLVIKARRKSGELIGVMLKEIGVTFDEMKNFFNKKRIFPVKKHISDIQDYLENNRPNSKLLSKTYVNNKTPIEIQCENGHRFTIYPVKLYRGSWCTECYLNDKRLGIDFLRKFIEGKGGRLISNSYKNLKTKIDVLCDKNHLFSATPDNLIYGNTWCPECNGIKKLNLDVIQEHVQKREGILISKNYVNIMMKLEIKCKNGHVFTVTARDLIHSNSWCSECYGNKPLTRQYIQEAVKTRHGTLLTSEEINSRSKIEIRCNREHNFQVKVNDMLYKNCWCPECSDSKSEKICRYLFESLFQKRFPTKIPSWLINSRGNKMHLDGYNEELQIAFEYNGIQHYKIHKIFSRNDKILKQRQLDDHTKKKLCEEHGITLIIIPYTIKYEKMLDFIVNTCKRKKISFPKKIVQINYEDYNL
ncbi:MAG: hypothetical protein ACFFCS_20275 [Candidatus Hodarchaeota archaeon]